MVPLKKPVKRAGRTGRQKSKLIPVQDVLNTVFHRLEMPGDLDLKGRVFLAWDEVLGPAAVHAHPFRFQGTTLIVEVTTPAWITELSIRKMDIINRLERAVGERTVQDIRFKLKRKREE